MISNVFLSTSHLFYVTWKRLILIYFHGYPPAGLPYSVTAPSVNKSFILILGGGTTIEANRCDREPLHTSQRTITVSSPQAPPLFPSSPLSPLWPVVSHEKVPARPTLPSAPLYPCCAACYLILWLWGAALAGRWTTCAGVSYSGCCAGEGVWLGTEVGGGQGEGVTTKWRGECGREGETMAKVWSVAWQGRLEGIRENSKETKRREGRSGECGGKIVNESITVKVRW